MFKIDIRDDRSPDRRPPDPVTAGIGVFAMLEPAELSPAEQGRAEAAKAADEARNARPARLWLARDVLRYLTNLYGRFTNPAKTQPAKTPSQTSAGDRP